MGTLAWTIHVAWWRRFRGPWQQQRGNKIISCGWEHNEEAKSAWRDRRVVGDILTPDILLKSSLWIFPEGTRTLRPEIDLLPFKKGAFHLAVQSGVPIVPVVCENYWRLYHKGVLDSGKLTIRGVYIPGKDVRMTCRLI